ncbi:ATP-binding protein [Streptomyces sp. NPDC052114]|uniref:NACHT domain-containing protein n=1 Tax=unclassified Streptomyces TaxID=2593676 RepID=UPI003443B594
MRAARLDSYLRAASRAAGRHPYPDPGDGSAPPPLATVYVRQKVTALRPGTYRGESLDPPAEAPAETALRLPAEPVLADDAPLRILVAGAGGGKSTLLRLQLADAAAHVLSSRRPARADHAVPVLVRATTLAVGPVLSDALAAAVAEELGPLGLREPLTADFFSSRPLPRAPWLVLVDGLDEVPQQKARIALLERLALEAEQQPCVYRFVVTTRPLPDGELFRPGPCAAYSELRLFTRSDVRAYARACFADLPDTKLHMNEFMTGLRMSGLEDPARTPLIASLLCRLYLADPTRPLPEGRTATYRSFVELLYEQNAHKDIRGTHDAAIRALKDQYQIPRDNRAAEQAAQGVRDQLPELIDQLAHERINGNTAPATGILAAHVPVRRPDRVTEARWTSFLGDLLRPTGLVAQRGDDFVFLHQTLLEYHAARHATRDRQARAELLGELFPHHHDPAAEATPPPFEASYLGFLLDGLLDHDDDVASAATRAVEHLGTHGRAGACRFLIDQTHLRTNLPRTTDGRLAGFAADTTLDIGQRVHAAWALSRLDGHRDASAGLLAAFAADTALHGSHRTKAAGLLARLDGHADEAAALLTAFATDTALDAEDRVYAAWALGQLDEHRADAVTFLVSFATDSAVPREHRVRALADLADAEGHGDEVAAAFLAVATDTTLGMWDRVKAAAYLERLDGHAQEALGVLTACAGDTALKPADRMQAAAHLARRDGHAEGAVALLTAFATDPALSGWDRAHAAGHLVGIDGHGEGAVDLLVTCATNTELDAWDRLEAALTLFRRAGDEHATELLTALVTDSGLDSLDRIDTVKRLAAMRPHKELAVELYAAIAADTTVPGTGRVLAALTMSDLSGGSPRTVRRLTALAEDTGLPARMRKLVVENLAALRGR